MKTSLLVMLLGFSLVLTGCVALAEPNSKPKSLPNFIELRKMPQGLEEQCASFNVSRNDSRGTYSFACIPFDGGINDSTSDENRFCICGVHACVLDRINGQYGNLTREAACIENITIFKMEVEKK